MVAWTCTKGMPSWQPPLRRCVMSDEQEQDSSPLMPVEQQTIMFGLLALIRNECARRCARKFCAISDGSVESRLEGLEEVTNLIPEILERLGPQTLTSDHRRAVQKYADIPDQDWPRVVQWFRAQLEPWRRK